jgi:hypothetical protein
MIIAIALAAAALGVAIGSWFRPAPEPTPAAEPVFTESQVADAKKQVCDAFQLARNAIVTAGNKQDPANAMAYAANARVAFFGGADYLGDIVSSLPATPSELADAAHEYSSAYKQLALVLLSDKTPQQMDQSIVASGDNSNEKLKQICQ